VVIAVSVSVILWVTGLHDCSMYYDNCVYNGNNMIKYLTENHLILDQ